MKMELRRRAVDKIYKRRDKIEMPDFQREEVWPEQKKQLLGPRLDEDEHRSLFQRDFRGRNATRTSDGSGAGLHFAKLVCDLHDIGISARSMQQEKLRISNVPYSYFSVTLEF
jgi:hypothetical protein